MSKDLFLGFLDWFCSRSKRRAIGLCLDGPKKRGSECEHDFNLQKFRHSLPMSLQLRTVVFGEEGVSPGYVIWVSE